MYKILLFAQLRERLAQAQIELKLPDDSSLRELRQFLLSEYPDHQAVINAARFAVDQVYAVDDEQMVAHTSELALIPPVSGG